MTTVQPYDQPRDGSTNMITQRDYLA